MRFGLLLANNGAGMCLAVRKQGVKKKNLAKVGTQGSSE